MDIYTIGFADKPAREFFTRLRTSGVRQLVDVRFDNMPSSGGYARGDDLAYFLESLCAMTYVHVPVLAPTQPMLRSYLELGGEWSTYERTFLALLATRRVEALIDRETLRDAVLLCSEGPPERCHRRLVAEYLQEHWEGLTVHHLT